MRAHGGGISQCRRRCAPQTRPKTETEMKEEANEGAYPGSFSPFQNFSLSRAENLPWNLVRVAIVAAAFQWLFMMVVTGVECVLGSESLLKPPGEPPWIRDIKSRSWTPEKVHTSVRKLPDDYRLFSASKARYDDSDDGAG